MTTKKNRADVGPQTRLEWALRMASMGLQVFPLRPDSKEPFGGESWVDLMTTDSDAIRGWFEHREDMNYGVCPGEAGVIIDLDLKESANGIEALAEIQAGQDILEWITDGGTFAVRTPSGGLHLYLETEHPTSNAHTFPEGVDVRGHRGYVVGPGSQVGSRPYTVEHDSPIATAPKWVTERLRRGRDRSEERREALFDLDGEEAVRRAVDFLKRREPAVEGMGGNDHTYATACLVKDYGLSEDRAVELMLDSWNERCESPWTADELASVVANAYRYGASPPGKRGGNVVELFGEPDGAQDVSTMELYADAPAARHARVLGHLFTGSISERPTPQTVIADWLPDHGIAALLARRGTGKTLVMTDMALRLAADMPWCGQPTMEGFHAVYICGEDAANTLNHVEAWCVKNGLEEPPERFHFISSAPDLTSAEDTREWAEALRHIVGPDGRAVVFLDTWQRASARGGQNRDEDMQRAVHHAEALARSLGGPAVVAFHPPKSGGGTILGSSVIENATTAIWELSESHGMKRIEVTRIKEQGEGSFQLFRTDSVGLGRRKAHGGALTGAVATRHGGVEVEDRRDRDRLVSEAYAELIYEAVRDSDDPANMTPTRVADLIAGRRMTIDGVDTKAMNRKDLRSELPRIFTLPCPLPDGNELALEDTGRKRGRGSGRVFRIRRPRDSGDSEGDSESECRNAG